MKRTRRPLMLAIIILAIAATAAYRDNWTLVPHFTVFAQGPPAWSQWGRNPQHTGAVPIAGQPLQTKLTDVVYDPFVKQESAEEGDGLLVHYQVPLTNGPRIFMEFKTGTYNSCVPPGSGQPFPCGPDDWQTEIWNERALHWKGGHLRQVWNFVSDWKPVPNDKKLGGWEPVFQPALSGPYIYVPGAGGTLYKLDQNNGKVVAQINPFGTVDPSVFVAGGVTADNSGNIYYNVIQLDLNNPWTNDVLSSYLVKVNPDNSTTKVTYHALLPNVPKTCLGTFSSQPLPWPPSPTAKPNYVKCGTQRTALNVAPAISANGSTIYTVSRGHFWGRGSYLLAVNTSDLSLQWAASLQARLNDGCNVILPPNGQPGGCRDGSTTGVDPTQNTKGGGIVQDQASSSPVVTPDGSILLGVDTAYNYSRGHLFRFGSKGKFQASYDFGWDTTPSIYRHGSTFSIILKDNHYDTGSYCNDPVWCPTASPGPYYITQLDSNLVPEWQFKNTTINKGHPNGFEWCVNAAAVDVNGVVYANSEDGNLYAIAQGGTQAQSIFLERVVGAAYTPLAIGGDGTVYALNDGHLMPVGK